jgi:protein ImuB
MSGAGGVRLYALGAAAAALGLRRGMTVADARAAVPDLRARDADPAGDAEALLQLARWCGRWTPFAAARPAQPGGDAVILETTGCGRVHGGEDSMLRDIAQHMARLGLDVRIAAAPTIGLAWGVSCTLTDAQPVSIAPEDARAALTRLPVRALRIDAETAGALEGLGLSHPGFLLPLRRADLARRFGPDLVRRLDQARGVEDEVLDPVLPAAVLRARRRYAEPLTGAQQIARAAAQAAADLCALLEREALGARRVALNLYRVDGRMFEIVCGAGAPVRDAGHLSRLLTERIERAELDAGFGIEIVEAAALTVDRLEPQQTGIMDDRDGADPARLSDRLAARLGEQAVLRPAAAASHAPERAGHWRRTGESEASADPRRPLLMLERPEPVEAISQLPDGPPRQFVWRRVRRRVARAEGPERVAPEWWRAPEQRERAGVRLTRDYFRVETEEGQRFFLFRDGLPGRETDAPRWFVWGTG